jgi:hypothetical protein
MAAPVFYPIFKHLPVEILRIYFGGRIQYIDY